jgi:hypothetical protein
VRFAVNIGVGDRVLTRVAARSEGVVNGMRGEVIQVDATPGHESVSVRLDDGATRHLGADYLRRSAGGLPALDLAYATTIHRNQGITAERSQVLIDRSLTGDAAYVALSRGRASNELVLVAAPRDNQDGAMHWDDASSPRRALADCLHTLERSVAKHLSIDAGAEPAALVNAARQEQLDGLVAAWRRSLSPGDGGSGAPLRSPATMPSPAVPTSDPHLLAIEELLAAPRAQVVDAVARYRTQLRHIATTACPDERSEGAATLTARQRDRASRTLSHPDDRDRTPKRVRRRKPSLRGPRLG